jgi:hypothetical protein
MAVLRQLQQVVPDVAYRDETLEAVLAGLRAHGLSNIVVDWQVIERDTPAGRNTEISLELKNQALGEVLDWVLQQASQEAAEPGQRLTWQVAGGVLHITTAGSLRNELVVRVYDVEDLAQNLVLYEDAPVIAVEAGASGGAGSGAGGGSMQGGGSIMRGGQVGQVSHAQNREQSIDDLIAAIKTAIEPRSWDDLGGGGSISALQGKLIVRQRLDIHEQLGGVRPARR